MTPDKRGVVQKILSLGEARDEDLAHHMMLVRDHRNCHPAMICRRLVPVDNARPR